MLTMTEQANDERTGSSKKSYLAKESDWCPEGRVMESKAIDDR